MISHSDDDKISFSMNISFLTMSLFQIWYFLWIPGSKHFGFHRACNSELNFHGHFNISQHARAFRQDLQIPGRAIKIIWLSSTFINVHSKYKRSSHWSQESRSIQWTPKCSTFLIVFRRLQTVRILIGVTFSTASSPRESQSSIVRAHVNHRITPRFTELNGRCSSGSQMRRGADSPEEVTPRSTGTVWEAV